MFCKCFILPVHVTTVSRSSVFPFTFYCSQIALILDYSFYSSRQLLFTPVWLIVASYVLICRQDTTHSLTEHKQLMLCRSIMLLYRCNVGALPQAINEVFDDAAAAWSH